MSDMPSDPYANPTPTGGAPGSDPAATAPQPTTPPPATPPPSPPIGSTDPTAAQALPTAAVVSPANAGSTPGPDDERRRPMWPWVAALAVLLVLILGVGAIALGTRSSSNSGATIAASSSAPTDAGRTAGGLIDQIEGATSTSPTTSQTSTSTPPTSKAPTSAAPTTTNVPTTTKPPLAFQSATAPESIACPDLGPGSPGAQPATVTISWNAPGATEVSLAVDGPGLYDTYPGASGSVKLPFGCTSTSHGQHTYLLTASGPNGVTATKTLVVRW